MGMEEINGLLFCIIIIVVSISSMRFKEPQNTLQANTWAYFREIALIYYIFWNEVVPEVYDYWKKHVNPTVRLKVGDKVKIAPWHFDKCGQDIKKLGRDHIYTVSMTYGPDAVGFHKNAISKKNSLELDGNTGHLAWYNPTNFLVLAEDDLAGSRQKGYPPKVGIYSELFEYYGKEMYQGRTPDEEAMVRARVFLKEKGFAL